MHSKLTGFADIELEVIVIAGCDEALSALCTPSSLSVKTASFSLEIIHLNHTCQHSDNILCAKILERLLHIHYNRQAWTDTDVHCNLTVAQRHTIRRRQFQFFLAQIRFC